MVWVRVRVRFRVRVKMRLKVRAGLGRKDFWKEEFCVRVRVSIAVRIWPTD